jgi:hypothetical protein
MSLTDSAESEESEVLGRGVATAKDPVQHPDGIPTMRDT